MSIQLHKHSTSSRMCACHSQEQFSVSSVFAGHSAAVLQDAVLDVQVCTHTSIMFLDITLTINLLTHICMQATIMTKMYLACARMQHVHISSRMCECNHQEQGSVGVLLGEPTPDAEHDVQVFTRNDTCMLRIS
jgi:hypothetical protein